MKSDANSVNAGMKCAKDDCRFVDLKARVGDSDEDEEDEDEDEDEEDEVVEPTDKNQYISFADMDKNLNQSGWSNLISSLEGRFASESGMTHGTAEGSHGIDHLAHHPTIAASIDNIICLPTEDDYPLWRVHCKAGLEEEIVFALLQTVYPRHEIRSAFANGLVVRGWVYMEATMNNHLQQLLRITPGILRNHYGICIQLIPFNEGMELLKMHSKDPLESGKWVQVRRGHYKGDVGYILSVAASEVHLLLIPRVAPDASRSKKKRRTTLELFNHETDEMLAAEVDV